MTPESGQMDIIALANTKLGNGSVWQGYYMYVGGLNPAVAMQEPHLTGYPNDLPIIDYDFHAPVGLTVGEIRLEWSTANLLTVLPRRDR